MLVPNIIGTTEQRRKVRLRLQLTEQVEDLTLLGPQRKSFSSFLNIRLSPAQDNERNIIHSKSENETSHFFFFNESLLKNG